MRRFVADASHELRTPLTSIRGFAELYRQGAVRTEDDVAPADGAHRGRGRPDGPAGRGPAAARPARPAAPAHRRARSTSPTIAGDAVHDARAVQPDRPIALHLDESLTDVPVVLGDEGRLRQVVGNLVTNALTHTPPDTRVTVTVGRGRRRPDVLRAAGRRRGAGHGRRPTPTRAFERFYRADTSRTRGRPGGTGLGLAIVASLVAAHGGSVELDTAPGQGATFTVRLPRSRPAGPRPTRRGADGGTATGG